MAQIQAKLQELFSLFSKKKNEWSEHTKITLPKFHLSRKEKIFFLDTLGSLISAGIPLVKSLKLIYFQSEKTSIRKISAYIKSEIELGKWLANIARAIPGIFSTFDAAMFEMGDATGKIGDIFRILTEKEEKTLELERKIKGALIYPIAIVVVAVLMVVILMIYVIPRIQKIYAEAHTSLPALTQWVINLSEFLRSSGLFVILGIALIWVGFFIAQKQKNIRIKIDASLLLLPIFGQLLKQKTLVIFSDFLSILLSSGITIHKALEIIASAISNTHYQRELELIAKEIIWGKHLSSALWGDYVEKRMSGEKLTKEERAEWERKLACFSIELTTAVKVGEQTGSLAKMLKKASDRYEREIDATVKSLSSLLEPIIIVVIGGIVGVVVLAIMMPFFNMVKVVG